jgi:hypothetical protein
MTGENLLSPKKLRGFNEIFQLPWNKDIGIKTNAMVLEEFWGDASSRTIDFRAACMLVATVFTNMLG